MAYSMKMKMKKKKLLIAIGGNAISPPDREVDVQDRLTNLEIFAASLKPLLKTHHLILTHGNGPDVGNLMLQQELARAKVAMKSLDTLNAMTQGQLGYWLQQAIYNVLGKRAVVLNTRVLVDRKDPAFRQKTKQVGAFYSRKIFPDMIFMDGKGYRRVVPSPQPLEIIEIKTISTLFELGEIVIAGGGGGIPVARVGKKLVGVDCVIDKDLLSARLASEIGGEQMVILTNVEGVYTGFSSKKKKFHPTLSLIEAEAFLREGEFGAGSMKPKIEAAVLFVRNGGEAAWIGSWKKLGAILKGKSGTKIVQ